jgi:hypothetical protein
MSATQVQILSGWVLGAIAIATISALFRHYKIQSNIRRLNGEGNRFHWHAIKEPQMYRCWLTFGDPAYRRKGVDFHWEVAYGKKAMALGPGFRIHLGDRGSETPFHFDVYLWFIAIFFSMNTPRMGELFERVGRGHKRDISVRYHNDKIWWNLWYDNDDGYDNYHEDHRWVIPKFWPFRNRKFRSWSCLRSGSIDVNPLNVWWGVRYYEYKTLDEDVLLIEINQFKGDEYMVEFKVQEQFRGRRNGPKWVRRKTHEGYTAEWCCKDGIPYRNHDWKGDNVYASAVSIPDPNVWRMDADDNLKAYIIDQRDKYDYRNPEQILKAIKSATPIFDAMQGQFLQLGAASGKAATSLKGFAEKFQEKLESDGGMIILPADSEMLVSPVENEKLKSMYTPEEMAQQVINRDKDGE